MDHFGESKKADVFDCLAAPLQALEITFVNCGNPFGKQGKALFKSRDVAHLDIAYS